MDYEQAVEDIYTSILRSGDVAIDCGAHKGRHTLPIAKLVGLTGRVYAFEPLRPIFERLVAATFGQDNIVAQNIALGEEETVSDFVYVPDFPEYSGFHERIYHDDSLVRQIIRVPVRRLDQVVIASSVRYIKIDAEGGDLKIIRGASQLIERTRPIVTFELGDNALRNYEYNSGDYYDFFVERMYKIFSITGIEMNREMLMESSRDQNIWDYIACPHEIVHELPFSSRASPWSRVRQVVRRLIR